MNEGAVSGELGLAGWPAVAEESIIARDVLLAEHVGARLHVCHVSTAGSVDVIRWAKARGIDVTAEVTPHHLLLTEELVARLRRALQGEPAAAPRRGRRGAARGPRRRHDRHRRDRPRAAPGRGEGVRVGRGRQRHGRARVRPRASCTPRWSTPACSTGRTSRACCRATPARIGRLAGHGAPLAAGQPRELTLYDPAAASDVLDSSDLAGRSVNSPYLGRALPGRVVATFHGGYATVARRRGAPCRRRGPSAADRWRPHVDRWLGRAHRGRHRGASLRGSWCARGSAARARDERLSSYPLPVAARHAPRSRPRCSTSRRPRTGEPLERLAVHGLAFRGAAPRRAWRPRGVVLRIAGRAGELPPADRIVVGRRGELRDRPRRRARRARGRHLDRERRRLEQATPHVDSYFGPGTRTTRRASSPPSTTSPPRGRVAAGTGERGLG